ncbi:hypothetical protein [Anaerosinus massiliensis]|uniref:hypothetical protein n=1 Tax=Massilibacillus massiliensis TaxID=1806837 RepID=UPI000DA60EC5|nr:hypothetical protein [Massilibacillus massiliensis]
MDFTLETPANIDELVKQASDKTNWPNRLSAVEELSKWKCEESIAIITQLATSDLVFKVKERAFEVAQAFGVEKNGKPIYLDKKPKVSSIKFINKKIFKVASHLKINIDDFNMDEFKAAFQKMYPEEYDVCEYENHNKFDAWLKDLVQSKVRRRNR